MRILGIDPGLRATGYSLLYGTPRGVRLLTSGVIRTDDSIPLASRLHTIHAALTELIGGTHPDGLAVEDLYAAQRFPRTAILMGHVRGVVCLAASQRGIDVMALAPAAVKQAIAGSGAASKAQVQRAVLRLLRGESSFDDAHASDAAAMALTALSRHGVPLMPDPMMSDPPATMEAMR